MNNGGVAIVVCGALAVYGTEVGWQHAQILWLLFVAVLVFVGLYGITSPQSRAKESGE